jgi:hypothetical protein
MFKQRRFKQQLLQDRLAALAGKIREQAAPLQLGPEKDGLLRKASEAEIASEVEKWLN